MADEELNLESLETPELVAQMMELDPWMQECYSRYMTHYHLGKGFYSENDHCVVDWYYADAVYADLWRFQVPSAKSAAWCCLESNASGVNN